SVRSRLRFGSLGLSSLDSTITGRSWSGGFGPAFISSNSRKNSLRHDRIDSGPALAGSHFSHTRTSSHRRIARRSGGSRSNGSPSWVGAGPFAEEGRGYRDRNS